MLTAAPTAIYAGLATSDPGAAAGLYSLLLELIGLLLGVVVALGVVLPVGLIAIGLRSWRSGEPGGVLQAAAGLLIVSCVTFAVCVALATEGPYRPRNLIYLLPMIGIWPDGIAPEHAAALWIGRIALVLLVGTGGSLAVALRRKRNLSPRSAERRVSSPD